MATSVPAARVNGHNGLVGAPGEITLSYSGKRALHEIRATPPANLQTLWTPAPDSGIEARSRLYYGDNLSILSALRTDPDVFGHVRLIYIDPPYATGGAFHSRNQEHAYADTLAGSEYVEALRSRLVLLYDLLAPDGSIYVHLDDYMAWPIKIIMDEIVGQRNYRNWITRKKCNPKNYTNKAFGNISDFILFYSKSDTYVWHRPLEGWTPERAAKEYQFVDVQGRRHKRVPIHAPGIRNGATGGPWRNMMPPPGKHWQYTPATLDAMDARGDIYWSKNGNPRRKVYFENSDGVAVQDIWLDCRDVHNQNTKITGYPTEKPPALLRRIIEAASNPGDIVLDCYAGSGTMLEVASDLKRRWIGMDDSMQAITAMLNRFAHGLQPMGDYVALRSRQAEKPQQLSLDIQDDGALRSLPTAREPVRDFALISEETVAENLAPDVLARLWPWYI